MYAQCDPDGDHYLMLDYIVDFRSSTTAFCYSEQNFAKNGCTYRRKYKSGWQLLFQWKDVSTSWQKLADLKQSHLIETSEYAISQNLQGEHVCNWWVPQVIKERKHIIFLVKKLSARYLKTTHKFGVRLPKSADKAYKIDSENGNFLWTNTIAMQMTNVKVALKPLQYGEYVPIGYAYVHCHMIFDV